MVTTKKWDGPTCPERVFPDGMTGSRACGRPLKTAEQVEAKMCGQHLAGRKRREASDTARQERDAAGRRLAAQGEADADALRKALGLGRAAIRSTWNSDEITLTHTAVEALLARLGEG